MQKMNFHPNFTSCTKATNKHIKQPYVKMKNYTFTVKNYSEKAV